MPLPPCDLAHNPGKLWGGGKATGRDMQGGQPSKTGRGLVLPLICLCTKVVFGIGALAPLSWSTSRQKVMGGGKATRRDISGGARATELPLPPGTGRKSESWKVMGGGARQLDVTCRGATLQNWSWPCFAFDLPLYEGCVQNRSPCPPELGHIWPESYGGGARQLDDVLGGLGHADGTPGCAPGFSAVQCASRPNCQA